MSNGLNMSNVQLYLRDLTLTKNIDKQLEIVNEMEIVYAIHDWDQFIDKLRSRIYQIYDKYRNGFSPDTVISDDFHYRIARFNKGIDILSRIIQAKKSSDAYIT